MASAFAAASAAASATVSYQNHIRFPSGMRNYNQLTTVLITDVICCETYNHSHIGIKINIRLQSEAVFSPHIYLWQYIMEACMTAITIKVFCQNGLKSCIVSIWTMAHITQVYLEPIQKVILHYWPQVWSCRLGLWLCLHSLLVLSWLCHKSLLASDSADIYLCFHFSENNDNNNKLI